MTRALRCVTIAIAVAACKPRPHASEVSTIDAEAKPFAAAFDGEQGDARLLVIVSPT